MRRVAKALTRIGKANASGVPRGTVQYSTVQYQSRNVHPSKRRGKAIDVVVPMSDNGRCQCEAKLCVGKKKNENDQNPLIGPLHPYLPANSDAK